MSRFVTLRYKTKTKKHMKLIFAGFVESVTSNIPVKNEYPIFISKGVTGGKKMYVVISNYAIKQKIKSSFLQELLIRLPVISSPNLTVLS